MAEYRSTKEWPYHISCGGLIYRPGETGREYALLYKGPRFGRGEGWHLPKGTLDSSETLEQCALREIEEESGLKVKIEGYLGTVHDVWVDDRKDLAIDKTIHYFLCRFLEGDGSLMDDEHEELQWHSAEEAKQKLAVQPKKEEQIVERAEQFITLTTK